MDNGLKILLKAYWSSEGWKNGSVSVDDFLRVKKEGYMFDYPKYISHDGAVKKLIDLVILQIIKKELYTLIMVI